MISVLTPIRRHETPADDLSGQTVQCHRYTHSCDIQDCRDNEAHNRDVLKRYASEPYTVLMDADVVLTEPDTIEQMTAFLDKYPLFPAVAVDTKGRDHCGRAYASSAGHTIIALLCIRKKALNALSFIHLSGDYEYQGLKDDACLLRNSIKLEKCLCPLVNREIREMYGVCIPYLRRISATENEVKKINRKM